MMARMQASFSPSPEEISALRRVSRSLVRDSARADDLAQDVLVRAVRHWDAYDPELGSVLTWLVVIARSLAINGFISDERRSRTLNAYGSEMRTVQAERCERHSAETLCLHCEEASAVRQVMATLAPDQRRVMELVDLAGLSYAEAARELGWPIGTVMSRLHRGRRRVEAILRGRL